MDNLFLPHSDNLYKFLALAGVVLVVFGVHTPLRRVSDLELRSAEIEAESRRVEARTAALNQYFILYLGQIGLWDSIPDAYLDPNADEALLRLWLSDSFYMQPSEKDRNDLRQLIDYNANIQGDAALLEGRIRQQELLVSEVERWTGIGMVSILLGFVMMVLGFRLWYIKVQRPQDEQIIANKNQPTE